VTNQTPTPFLLQLLLITPASITPTIKSAYHFFDPDAMDSVKKWEWRSGENYGILFVGSAL
jgi:hypothetical protein